MDQQVDPIVSHRLVTSKLPLAYSRGPHLVLIDYLTLGYLGVTGLIFLAAGHPTLLWIAQLLLRVVVAAGILWLIKAEASRPSTLLSFLRYAYPLILSVFLFEEIGRSLPRMFPFWFERYVLSLEAWMFGGYPSLWLARRMTPKLLELMSFGYASYYLLLPGAAIAVFVYARREQALRFMALLSGTLYLCYLFFLLFPVRGPHNTILGGMPYSSKVGFFHGFVTTIQNYAAVTGAAFPSSHVAGAWAVLLGVQHSWRRAGYWLALPVLWITFSVVFVFYHYAVDAIGGVLFAVAVYAIWHFIEPGARRSVPARSAMVARDHVEQIAGVHM